MIEKILVPVDSITFDNTLLAVENAIEFAKRHGKGGGPELIFIHVWNVDSDRISASDEKRLRRLRKNEMEGEFKEIEKMCESEDVEEFKTKFYEGGEADKEIVSFAKENDVDLIVIGSGKIHDKTIQGKIKKFIYGSVTESVIHEAPCSIFVVRTKN
ncbi:MAG: universal stress protein [Candidatus Hadarchaeia archaeon]